MLNLGLRTSITALNKYSDHFFHFRPGEKGLYSVISSLYTRVAPNATGMQGLQDMLLS